MLVAMKWFKNTQKYPNAVSHDLKMGVDIPQFYQVACQLQNFLTELKIFGTGKCFSAWRKFQIQAI